MESRNGDYNSRVEVLMLSIRKDVTDIQRNMREDRKDLTRLAGSIDGLSHSILEFKKLFSKAVPINVVGWMFGILVLALAGVEAVQWFFKSHLIK